ESRTRMPREAPEEISIAPFFSRGNRLVKVLRHLGKQAKRLNISCYRVYDHDLPEFPFCIEIYEDKLYVAEYKRQHRMTDEEHNEWIKNSMEATKEIFKI